MNIFEVDLSGAVRALAVANTPFFLVRNLKNEFTTEFISKHFSDEEILSGLRSVLEIGPNDLVNSVRPYVYLVSLWMKPRREALTLASGMNASRWGWYTVIASYLLETYSPILTQTIVAPAQQAVLSTSPVSTTSTSRIILP